jgi:hypothetical protein
MMSKKLIGKNLSENSLNDSLPEKLKSMGVEEAFRARSARKRHSIQLDKRISIQLQERRSSNASSTSDTADSVCKCSVGRDASSTSDTADSVCKCSVDRDTAYSVCKWSIDRDASQTSDNAYCVYKCSIDRDTAYSVSVQ